MMVWLFVVFPVVTALLFFGRNLLIRKLARFPFRWTFSPANTFAIVVTEENDVDNTERGGNIVGVVHAVPGKILVRDNSDPMEWHFDGGTDPDHETYLFKRLGVQDMGSIFYKLRRNVDKRERYARDPENPEQGLKTIAKKRETKFVFFTGEMEIPVKGADTADRISLDFKVNFIFERTFPVRSILRLADAPAFLASFVENIINNETSSRNAEYYYGGKGAGENRKELGELLNAKLLGGEDDEFKKAVAGELGLTITAVAIHDVDMEKEYKNLLARKLTAEKEGEAALITATKRGEAEAAEAKGKREAKILLAEGDEYRLKNVILPAAENELTSEVFRSDREAAAYENNKTITTWVSGGTPVIGVGK